MIKLAVAHNCAINACAKMCLKRAFTLVLGGFLVEFLKSGYSFLLCVNCISVGVGVKKSII